MNKLGFVIKYAQEGLYTIAECNGDMGSWRKRVIDTRDYLGFFTELTDKEIFTFCLFDKEGTYLVQQKPIPGRTNDYRSAWIYIPNTLVISTDEIVEAYNFARKTILSGNLHDIEETAKDFFSKKYPEKIGGTYVRSDGDKYAYRILDKRYSFSEILHKGLYQNSYKGYKAIFLLENTIAERISSIGLPLLEDITEKKIVKLCSLAITDENGYLKGGNLMYSKDNMRMYPLDSSLFFDEGTTISVFAKRTGFENVPIGKITMSEEYKVVPLDKPLDWEKRVLPSCFDVVDSYNEKSIDGARIKVNGKELDFNGILLSEVECSMVNYEVKADGYVPQKSVHPVNILNGPVRVKMERANITVSCNILLANHHKASLTLESIHIHRRDEYDNLLTGYSYDDEKRLLKPNSGKKWLDRVIGFVSAFILAIVLGVGYVVINFINNYELKRGWPFYEKTTVVEVVNDTIDSDSDDSAPAVVTKTDKEKAMEYMNNNQKWRKDSLEAFEPTRRLYDMINRYDFNSLAVMSDFDSCEKFVEIKKVAKKMMTNNCKMSREYCTDGIITVKSWLNTVNNEYNKKKNPPTQEDVAKSSKMKTIKNKGPGKGNQGQNNTTGGQKQEDPRTLSKPI